MSGIDVRDRNVFLSGPITGIEGLNKEMFTSAQELIENLGAAVVFNPLHELQRGHRSEWYYGRCINLLTMVRPSNGVISELNFYDLLVSLPGWEKSKGASLERAVAEAVGIECVEFEDIIRQGEK